MKTHFRVLAGLGLFFHAVGLFALPNLPFLFSAEVVQLAQYSGHGAKINVHHPVIYVFYLLPYPALLGMAFFKNWARHLMLLFISFMLVLTFFFGASVSGPPETFVSGAAILLDGAVLGLAFASPLRDLFTDVRT